MDSVIVFVYMGVVTALILVLGLALCRRLDGLPSRIVNLAARERADGERKAMTVLQETAAARVGVLVKSLRDHEEALANAWRIQIGDAQVRARVVEREASAAGVALSTAVVLVRDLRGLLDRQIADAYAPSQPAPTVTEGRATIEIEPEALDTTRKPDRPEPTSRERPSPRTGLASGVAPAPKDEGEQLSEDELTCVTSRPLPGLPAAGPTPVSPASGKGGAR
jgi:hypothetical protein